MAETATQTRKLTAAERAEYRRETYMVHDSEDCVGTYSASEDTIEYILKI